jgi:hypothetical protein
MTNDPSGGGVPVTLYRIEEIPSKQKLYKIDINAQQNHLTGVAVLVDPNPYPYSQPLPQPQP